MFEKDYFAQEIETGPGRAGTVVGAAGAWGLHLAKLLFLLYSGYHGISASLGYAGSSELAKTAQIFGIIVLEITLFSLYLAWHNQKITGATQSIAAGLTYAVGFILACLGIVADSQLHAGLALSGWLSAYLQWGLPIAPAVMALGALLTHELDPQQLRHRAQSAEQLAFTEDQFAAQMAAMRAEMAAARTLKNMQLNARMSAAKQIAAWYSSDEAQRAITATALQNAPALLRAIGVEFEGANAVIPGETAGNDRGQNDASHSNEKPLSEHEIADWLARHPEAAATVLGLVWPDRVDDRVTAEGENGVRPTRPRPASDGRGAEG